MVASKYEVRTSGGDKFIVEADDAMTDATGAVTFYKNLSGKPGDMVTVLMLAPGQWLTVKRVEPDGE